MLQFIDNASIDREARRAIRSHAAKGKNLGKGRPRRKPAQVEGRPPRRVADGTRLPASHLSNTNADVSLSLVVERPLTDLLSTLALPFELDPHSRASFKQVVEFANVSQYPSVIGSIISLDMSKSTWVRLVFTNEAYFHCAMAAMMAAISSYGPRRHNTPEAMRHLAYSLRLVNQKLLGDEATSDTTVMAVVGMTQYERLSGQHRRGLVHLDGLEHLVRLRGGMEQLARIHWPLAQKVLRTDLDFALHLGTFTRFSYHDIPASNVMNLLGSVHSHHAQQLENISTSFTLDPELQSVTSDILQVAALLNHYHRTDKKINGHLFHDTIIWIGYRLVHLGPLDNPRPVHGPRNMLHLGLMAFMANFLAGLDRRIPRLPQLGGLIRAAVSQQHETSRKTCELTMWTLFMGKSATFMLLDDEWVMPELARITQIIDLSTPEELLQTLSKYPWVDVLHDNMAQTIWAAISHYRKIPPLFGI